MAVEVGSAYISLQASTKDLDKSINDAFNRTARAADRAGNTIGTKMSGGITTHLARAGVTSGEVFDKSFSPRMAAAGKNAMLGLSNAMVGFADGVGSKVGGRISGGMATAIARSSTAAVSALGTVGTAATGMGAAVVAGASLAAGAVAVLGTAAVAASTKLYQMGSRWDDISDNMLVKTGLVGAEMDKLSASIDNVVSRSASAPGAIAAVAATLVQTMHLQGSALETVTKQIADYNDMNADAPLNVREFAKTMKQFKVAAEEVPDVLDRLNIVAQETGVPLNELVSSLKTAGPQAREFGLSIDGLAQLMATFEDAGLDGTSAATSLRVALGNLAKSKPGEDPAVALRNTVTEIQRLQDVGNKTAAIDLTKATFGRSWTQIYDLISDNRLNLDGMNARIDTSGRRIEDVRRKTGDWREDWNTLKNTIDEALKPLSTSLFDNLQKALIQINDWVRDLFNLGPAGPTGTANAAPTVPFNAGPVAPGAAGQRFGVGGMGQPGSGMSRSGSLGAGAPTSSGAGPLLLPTGGEPRRVGSSANMLPDAVALKDRLTTMFPEITDVGGYRPPDRNAYGNFDEHASGKAFDIMVPKQFMDPKTGKATPEGIQWGNRVLAEALKQGASVLWQQQQFDPGGATTPMDDRGGDPTQNHFDHLHVLWGSYANYASGGHVRGAGTGTSDSIPAMLSNGEHVLTARDVAAMGGQDKVYAFRTALQAGLLPGFDQGGAVDPDKLRELQDRAADLATSWLAAQAQVAELPTDATYLDRRSAQIGSARAGREYQAAQDAAKAYEAGRTPTDLSQQNRIYDLTDAVELSQLRLDAAKSAGDTPQSQLLQLQYSAEQAVRDRNRAIAEINKPEKSDTPPGFLDNLIRTQGFTPSGGGGKAGTSSLAGFINMGNEVVGGLIDTGASLAQTAVSAATSAAGGALAGSGAGPGGPIAGMVANAAANYGIQLGAAQLKRISSYWFGAAGIGADALIAQMFPFGGPPRWIGYDYTAMTPQLGIQQAALTTIEQMGAKAIQDYFNPKTQQNINVPGVPQASGSFSIPNQTGPSNITAPVGGGVSGPPGPPMQGNSLDRPMADLFDPTRRPPETPVPQGGWPQQYDWFKNQLFGMAEGGAVFDRGGMLQPGQVGINLSSRPEPVLTPQQWDALTQLGEPARNSPLVKIDTIYGMDPEDVAKQIEARQRLAAMQYSGRPY